MVVEPTVLALPAAGLQRIVRRVRGPFERRGAPLPVVADRAADVGHLVRAERTDEQIEPRMAGVRIGQAAPHRQLQGLTPLDVFEQLGIDLRLALNLHIIDGLDDVADFELGLGRGRLGADHADHRLVEIEQSLLGKLQSKNFLEQFVKRFVAVVRSSGSFAQPAGLGRGAHRQHHRVPRLIERLDRRAGRRLVHRQVAIRAAIEAGHVAKIVVDRQLGQPDLIDLSSAKRVEDRQADHLAHGLILAIVESFLELDPLVDQVVQRFLGVGFVRGHLGHDRFQVCGAMVLASCKLDSRVPP